MDTRLRTSCERAADAMRCPCLDSLLKRVSHGDESAVPLIDAATADEADVETISEKRVIEEQIR